MSNRFGDVLYINTPYRPESGSFCKPGEMIGNRYKVGQWYYCRDLFHAQLPNLNLFFFSHESAKGYCVASFMRKIEEALNVEPRSDFGPTQRKTIMWIEPSYWWISRTMKRSLFTILLRSGMGYSPSKDNFEEALLSDPYSMVTKYAINRFMEGNTHYTGKKRGWYRQFYESKPTKEQIDKLLIKPF
jgi:hypothetical protein